jgi:hypothetical protein
MKTNNNNIVSLRTFGTCISFVKNFSVWLKFYSSIQGFLWAAFVTCQYHGSNSGLVWEIVFWSKVYFHLLFKLFSPFQRQTIILILFSLLFLFIYFNYFHLSTTNNNIIDSLRHLSVFVSSRIIGLDHRNK